MNYLYKDGITLKKYYCKVCGESISLRSGLYLRGLCRKHCFNKETKEKMSLSRQGKCPWNKDLTGLKGYWEGKSNKDIIVRHHIDGNKKNNDESNFLKMTHSEHRSLHWRAYEYLVSSDLINHYLSEFITKYGIKSDRNTCKVIHHIDCKRSNNGENNLLYLKDKKIHNKLHQEAYLYVVRKNRVNDYIDCFFLWKKGNYQRVRANEELV